MSNEAIKVANLSDITSGSVKVVSADGHQVALCNVDGRVYAIEDVCTHDNAPLDQGKLEGQQIECPRHGARFDVTTGKALCLPAVRPVATYKVNIKNDEIWLEVNES